MTELLEYIAEVEKLEQKLTNKSPTKEDKLRELVYENRKERSRRIDRLRKAKTRASMTPEQKEEMRRKDRLRKSRKKDQAGKETRSGHGKPKQRNMENGGGEDWEGD